MSDIAEELKTSCVGTKLEKVKLLCTYTTDDCNAFIFSPAEINAIKKGKSIFDIFDVIRPHWSWHSHRLLPAIIKRVGSPKASELLKKFEAKIKYNAKLKELDKIFKQFKKPIPPDYCQMVGIINKDYDEIVLEDCFKIDTYVSETLGQFENTEISKNNSVKFVWLVPIAEVPVLCQKATQIKEELKRESFLFLGINGITIFDNRNAALEVHKL